MNPEEPKITLTFDKLAEVLYHRSIDLTALALASLNLQAEILAKLTNADRNDIWKQAHEHFDELKAHIALELAAQYGTPNMNISNLFPDKPKQE
jgi:hypothetical protein